MKPLFARIRKLEDRYGAPIEAQRNGHGPSGTDVLTGILARFGIVPGWDESLAATTARAVGISGQDLKRELQQRAFGGPR